MRQQFVPQWPMRPIVSRFFLPSIALLITMRLSAQTCTGSLGDPVINETFGAGSTYGTGPALSGSVTTYQYTPQGCPIDGSYTISTNSGNCFFATWQVVPQDHTGDKNGYMMIVNSSEKPGQFYEQRASGNKLCPNTTYEFAAWIMNVIRDGPNTVNFIRPNITFIVQTASGRELARRQTGDIEQGDQTGFKQYGLFFTSPATGEDVIVRLINNAPGGSGNDLILDDITFRPCGPVIQTGFGDVVTTADRDLCEGESGTYILKAQQTGYNDPYYQWQVNANDGAGWRDIAGETNTTLNRSFTNAVAGKYQYRIGVLDGPGASLTCRIYSQPLSINVNPLPVINIKPESIFCEGVELRLTATGGDQYHWTGPNNFSSDEQSPVVTYNADNSRNGLYTVTVTKKGCPSTASTTVIVKPKVTPVVSGDVTICEGESTQLVAGGGITYTWTPAIGLDNDNVANPVARPSETTLYHVRVDNGGCVDESKTILVTVLKRPYASAGPDLTIQEGESVVLNGVVTGDNIRYYWTPGDQLSDATSVTPMASPAENVTYTLHAESQDNCGAVIDEVFVRVYRRITIPNTFSPNGDGINDLWNIDKLDTYPECVLTVYNRAGTALFRSVGYSRPWTGTYNGRALPPGTYYYVLDLKNSTPVRSGWVMLVR